MKKTAFLAIILICACILSSLPALAETDSYYKVTAKNACLYETADSGGFQIFNIVENCYVLDLGENVNGFRKVSYMGVVGYVPEAKLSANTVNALRFTGNSYYHEPITFHVAEGKHLTLEPGGSRKINGVDTTKTFTLLGVIRSGSADYACVLYGSGSGDYGYVNVADTDWDYFSEQITAPTLYVEPSPSPIIIPSPSIDTAPDVSFTPVVTNPETDLVKVLLIIGISVPAIIVVFLVFKPVKEPHGKYAIDRSKRSRYDDFDDFD